MFTNKKNILFTFDYELFLGSKSGSVLNCLINPTNLILETFNQFNIKNAIFFVDTVYLMRLKKQLNDRCKSDYNLIESQLIKIINENHFIFPHIHPHWLDAKYIDEINQWDLSNYSKYRFHNIDFETREILFSESLKIINDIISKSNTNYKVNSYRAGGWSIQPFSDFMPLFEKFKITNDFSVIKGFINNSTAQFLDFTNCPDKNIYKFKDDPCKENNTGNYTEYCISTVKLNSPQIKLNKLVNKFLWQTGDRNFGDGLSLIIKDETHIGKNKDMFGASNTEMISLELLNIIKLPMYKSYIKNNDFIQFISHPKMISPHNLNCFNKLLKSITCNYQIQTDFSHISSN